MTGRDDLVAVLERSRALGLLGPGDIDAQLHHAAGFVALTSDPAGAVLDLGSGGGIPGLVIAVEHPDVEMVLLDAAERRGAFLRDAVRRLGLGGRVRIEVGRAETLARDRRLREQFAVVVSRSFGPPAVTAECAAGFLALGGRLFVSEPGDGVDRWPEEGLATLGLAPVHRHLGPDSTIQELRRSAAGLDGVPRGVGVPTRRPLF